MQIATNDILRSGRRQHSLWWPWICVNHSIDWGLAVLQYGYVRLVWSLFSSQYGRQRHDLNDDMRQISGAHGAYCTKCLLEIRYNRQSQEQSSVCETDQGVCWLLQSALLFYWKLWGNLMYKGLIINTHEPCVGSCQSNESQMMVIWHVDELKISFKSINEIF